MLLVLEQQKQCFHADERNAKDICEGIETKRFLFSSSQERPETSRCAFRDVENG